MTRIAKDTLETMLAEKLRRPWIGTLVLTVLGTIGSIFPVSLFHGVNLVMGSLAALVVLRMFGGIYAMVSILLINMMYMLITGDWTHNLVDMTIVVPEIACVWYLQYKRKNTSVLKADTFYWIFMIIPFFVIGQWGLNKGLDNIQYYYLSYSVNGMVNALIAGVIIDYWITKYPTKRERPFTIPLSRIASKYVVAFVVVVSLMLITADSRRQMNDIKSSILANLKHAAYGVIQDSNRGILNLENITDSMQLYKEFYAVNLVIVDREERIVASAIDEINSGETLDLSGYHMIDIDETQVYQRNTDKFERDVLQNWKNTSFIYEINIPDVFPYKMLIEMDSKQYYSHVRKIYLLAFQSIYLIMLTSMMVASPLSKKVVSPMKGLTRLTGSLPLILFRERQISWPSSHVTEVQILINNLRKMANVLVEQFEQIRQDKMTLEDRVNQRTSELQNSEEIKKAIIDSSIDPIVSVEPSGIIIEFNPAAEQLFGWQRKEVVGLVQASSLFKGASCEEIKNRLNGFGYVRHQRFVVLTDEISGLHRDGSTFPIEYKIVEIQVGNNESLYNLFIRDMTERTIAEEEKVRQALALENLNGELVKGKSAIEEQRDISEHFIESVREGLVMCDPKGVITIVNHQIELMFGLGHYRGKSISEFAKEIDNASTKVDLQLAEKVNSFLLRELSFIETEFTYGAVGSEGNVFSLYIKHVESPHKSINHGFLLVFRDRTEEERLNRMKNELISVVSHELRTPIAAIMGHVELMLMYDIPSEKRNQFMQTISAEGTRLTGLLDDFLDIQRLENDRMTYHMTYVPLFEMVEGVAEQWNLKAKQRIYVHALDGDFFAYADRNRMIQVLHNIVGNAVKYSPGADRIDITVWEGEEYLCVDVRDYGIGIAENVQDNLFTKFYRVDNSDHRQIGGTGLGLYISKRIVEDHEGTLTFSSTPNKGSTFMIRLPKYDELI
ncbi:ATP-binding protein [Paenibacillus xylanilyticus]|uniref:PAS domain-containing sensor histidine kinase n=1 Tax=Paenibacillus xylanilyticus TaxID=248903 RepID=UPI003AAB4044